MNRWICLCLVLLFQQLSSFASSPVVITELMANNTRTLFDEDGDSEDWIEIHNVSNDAVNLLGWSLTDDHGDLTKWRFPATNLNAGAFMVVFASNKDRKVAGRTLHTNFRLSPDGDYLALVQPDGLTIATEFSPSYPVQVPNVSFGFGVVSSNTTLLSPGASMRVLVPTPGNGGSTLGDTWKGGNEPFADGGWRTGVTGAGFSAAGAPSLVATSALTLRFNFDAPPAGNIIVDTKPIGNPNNGVNTGAVWLPSSTDEAPIPVSRSGVMRFNAVDVTQITVTASPNFNSIRGTICFWMRSFGFSGAGQGPAVVFDRQVLAANLASGAYLAQVEDGRLQWTGLTNGLAGNVTLTSSSPSDDRWHHIAIAYDQGVGGTVAIYVDGALDGTSTNARAWTWPGNQQVLLGRSTETSFPSFRKYNGQLDDFRIYNRQLTPAEVAQLRAGDGGVPAAEIGTDVTAEMLNVNSTAFVRVPFTVADTNAYSLLTLRVRYNDGFAAWINGRLVASVNTPDPVNWDSAATASGPASQTASITLGNPASLLLPGTNILAIQGLNINAADPTFLVLPELTAASVPVDGAFGMYFTQPTPGSANTGGTTNVGPAISEVVHIPNVPNDAEDLRVSARVGPTFNAISNVTLRYRIMYLNEVSVPMNDAGLNGDLAAGDGIWSGLVPASASTNGQMVRYYVTAQDIRGNPARWPLFYSPTNSEQYLGTIVEPEGLTSSLPIYHTFINPTDAGAADGESGARCSIFYDGEFYDNVRIELRGNTSAGFRKKAHRLEFNRDHRFRHRPGFPRIGDTSFLGESADPAYLRQAFCFLLMDEMGVPGPFSYPVRLQQNGQFYQLALHSDVMGMEQLERLGYDPQGALYKAVGNLVPGFNSTGGFEKRTRVYEDRSDYLALANGISESQPLNTRRTNLFDMIDVPNAVNYLAVARWCQEGDDVWANMTIYRDTLGDQMWRVIPFDMNVSWGQLYCGDTPSVYQNIIATNDLYKGHPLYGGSGVPVAGGGSGFNRMYDVIISVPEAREMLLRRMRTLMDNFIQPPDTHPLAYQLEQQMLSFSNAVYPESILDRLKWGWESTTLGQANGPYCFGANQWLTNHLPEIMTKFLIPRRQHWFVAHSITNTAKAIGVATNLNAGIPTLQPSNAVISVAGLEYSPASGNQNEEYICLTNGNPYAVDISGWQLGGGVEFTFKGGTVLGSNRVLYVSPNIAAFRNRAVTPHGGMGLLAVGPYHGQLSARGEPITIRDDHGRLVYTNSYPGTPSLPQQFLRITEIMYNPTPLVGSTNDPQDFEYVELKNISPTTPIDLTGVRFVNGIFFDFTGSAVTTLAPGARVLVVGNLAAFTARYGAAQVAGEYAGNLDNKGERVQLLDSVNEEILDFSYNNSWYPATDGLGFSLVIQDENATDLDLWGHKEGWRSSGQVNGAPGAADPPGPSFPSIVVNEVLAHTDLPAVDVIELYNPTTDPVNLGGWYLSDNFDVPKKYRITNGCVIAAGGYVTFDANLFNNAATALVPFSLSSKGDTVWLFSGDGAGALTGYVFGEDFGASANGVSLGRYTNSVGTVNFVAQSAKTLGGANAGPLVGPVVISEIMYHPPDLPGAVDDSQNEYVELQNITGSPVALYDPGAPSHTWRLRGGVDYEFPSGLTLPAGGTLLVINFDTNEVRKLAAFKTKYAVPAGVPVFGPYQGKLDNSSDDVKLERPDTPELGETPYVLVDRVEYRDDQGWPAEADGAGASLQRVVSSAYGNDPANWTAGTPRAGAGFPGGIGPIITAQPADRGALATQSAAFMVGVSSPTPVSYQWRFNGVNINGATGPMLVLTALTVSQSGPYSVVVFNAAGSVTSSNAVLTVQLPAYITGHPSGLSLRGSTNNADYGFTTNSAHFSVTAIGSGNLSYQWRFNNVNIDGATDFSVTVPNVGIANDGLYDVLVTDAFGTIPSSAARLKVLVTPNILVAPTAQTVLTNESFTTSVVIRGNPPPYRYEWREVSAIRGASTNAATTNFFTFGPLSGVFNNRTVQWRLVIFNDATPPQGVLSSFLVTAAQDADGDGLPDTFESGFGLDPAGGGEVDTDGDGMSNRAEYLAGTDPTNALSRLQLTQQVVGNTTVLSFDAQAGKTYSVQYTDALRAPAWTKLVDVIGGAARPITVSDSGVQATRFYRVVSPQRP